MKKWISAILILAALGVVGCTLAILGRRAGLPTNAFALAAVLAAIYLPPVRALATAWGTGLVCDVLSVGPLGAYALLLLLATLIILRLRAWAYVDTVPAAFVIALTTTIASEAAYGIALFMHYPELALPRTLAALPAEGLTTGAVTALAVLVGRAWRRGRYGRMRPRFT